MKPNTVVTGGTSGIGAGVAEVLHSAGYQVIAATVSQAEIDRFTGSPEIETRLLDVTDSTSVNAPFKGLDNLAGLVSIPEQ